MPIALHGVSGPLTFDLVTGDVGRLSGRPAQSVEEFLSRALTNSATQSGHA